jgi:hypothetical protein
MKAFIKQLLREELSSHDIEVMLNDIKPDCDCCQYFDMDSIDKFGGMEHPIYYMIEKGEVHRLDHVKPKQYIHKIAHGFGVSYHDALGGAYDENKAKKYAEAMKSGDKFPIGYYTENGGDQEGRHRAMAAMMLGCERIPVIKINKTKPDYINSIVKELVGLSNEEIDKIYKDKGYHGVTGLDLRTLKNYIEYRLPKTSNEIPEDSKYDELRKVKNSPEYKDLTLPQFKQKLTDKLDTIRNNDEFDYYEGLITQLSQL